MRRVFNLDHGNQGLLGAFEQYFTVEDKPRLYRRNTYFEDKYNSIYNNPKTGIIAFVILLLGFGLILLWSVGL